MEDRKKSLRRVLIFFAAMFCLAVTILGIGGLIFEKKASHLAFFAVTMVLGAYGVYKLLIPAIRGIIEDIQEDIDS